ncbi:hypothetical protein GCM10010178_68970 [Lentzea flava]|uniref:Uncharacterized protein n=2 Tax=Lentzea flava TaxID=103732 RepID=A0ABQ2V4Y8_9PSEU|nr:hypothetical protein [Lentzea flava]GGU67350.1 hypothetical protein GCM10010178_68970 [Lentzea flava]
MLVAVLSVFGALGAQWLNSVRAFRLAEIERRAKREERLQQNRADTYAKFLVAARALRPALRSGAGTGEAALATLRDAAAYIELNAPELADGALAAVLDTGERWSELVLSNPPTAPAVTEADEEFHHAVRTLRDLMRKDLADE